MKSWLSFLPLALFALLLGGFVIALHHSHQPKFAQHVGDPVPVTNLPLIGASGANFATSDWQGRVYIINFFASWCVPCRAESEQLLHLAELRVPMVGVAYKDKMEAAMRFLSREGNPFLAVAQDADGRAGIDWGITGVPETFVIDQQGIIRFHLVGVLTDDIITDELEPLLRELK